LTIRHKGIDREWTTGRVWTSKASADALHFGDTGDSGDKV
jgi:hypothetical protein